MPAVHPPADAPVNLGCGARYLPGWLNLDLAAHAEGVVVFDLREALPLPDASTPFVYSSHLLEHLAPDDAERLVREIARVLAPGGIVRLVVPDLEILARWYLEDLQKAGTEVEWSRLHLIDQLVRSSSGGEMRRYLQQADAAGIAFALSRMGSEVEGTAERPRPVASPLVRLMRGELGPHLATRAVRRLRAGLAELAVRAFTGRAGADAWKRARFAMTGENHRGMYDRVNLGRLLAKAGFQDLQRRSATTSGWPGWVDAQALDVDPGGKAYKPESIYFEGRK